MPIYQLDYIHANWRLNLDLRSFNVLLDLRHKKVR